MELFLVREDLWSIIEQEIPDAKADTYKAWKIKNDKARATIGLMVDETQTPLIRKLKNAKDIWETLKEYHQTSTLSNKVYYLKKLCRAKLKDGVSMEAHLFFMKEIFEKLLVMRIVGGQRN